MGLDVLNHMGRQVIQFRPMDLTVDNRMDAPYKGTLWYKML